MGTFMTMATYSKLAFKFTMRVLEKPSQFSLVFFWFFYKTLFLIVEWEETLCAQSWISWTRSKMLKLSGRFARKGELMAISNKSKGLAKNCQSSFLHLG